MWRKVLYSLVVVCLILAGAEAALRYMDYQGTTLAELVVTSSIPPSIYIERRDRALGDWFLPERGPDGAAWMRANPAFKPRGFHDERFPRNPGEQVRLFALGGSTTFGAPFIRVERGFPERLEAVLKRLRPGVAWRVVNAGVAGMDSGSFHGVAKEVLGLGAQGLIVYAGNNELRGRALDRCTNPYRLGLERQLDWFRLGRLIRSLTRSLHKEGKTENLKLNENLHGLCLTRLLEEISQTPAPSVHAVPAGAVSRGDAHYRLVLRSFEQNLEKLAALARSHDVPIFLAIPSANLLHPPVKPMPRPGLSKDAWGELHLAVNRLKFTWYNKDRAAAVAAAEAALAVDPGHALANHRLGLLELAAGRKARARVLLQNAIDGDYKGNRPTRGVRKILLEICHRNEGVTCVDMRPRFDEMAILGLPGYDLFVDYCHPTMFPGVSLIAEAFSDAILASGMAKQ